MLTIRATILQFRAINYIYTYIHIYIQVAVSLCVYNFQVLKWGCVVVCLVFDNHHQVDFSIVKIWSDCQFEGSFCLGFMDKPVFYVLYIFSSFLCLQGEHAPHLRYETHLGITWVCYNQASTQQKQHQQVCRLLSGHVWLSLVVCTISQPFCFSNLPVVLWFIWALSCLLFFFFFAHSLLLFFFKPGYYFCVLLFKSLIITTTTFVILMAVCN